LKVNNMPISYGYHEEAISADGVGEAASLNADTSTGDPAAPAWQWSENVAGEGAAPEWLKGDKYKTVEAQAKAYGELEGKFGSFTGAPEEYDVNISDELKEKGFNVDADDPVIQEFSKWAKESNLSQEGYNGLIELKGMLDAAESQAAEDHMADELKQLGAQGQARIDNINTWANANLPADMIDGFNGMVTNAASATAMEALIAKTRNAPISPEVLTPQTSVSMDELKTMQFAKDEHGNRKMQDPAYRARFQKLSEEVHGAGPARQTIG
jgi:hypothetical protein